MWLRRSGRAGGPESGRMASERCRRVRLTGAAPRTTRGGNEKRSSSKTWEPGGRSSRARSRHVGRVQRGTASAQRASSRCRASSRSRHSGARRAYPGTRASACRRQTHCCEAESTLDRERLVCRLSDYNRLCINYSSARAVGTQSGDLEPSTAAAAAAAGPRHRHASLTLVCGWIHSPACAAGA